MSNDTVLLTVRGTFTASSLDAARVFHNETAGSAPGIAAARALGDLSHKVYAPAAAGPMTGATDTEILFLDTWESAQGIQDFFGNPHVRESAGRMFSQRDASVWMPARGAFTFNLGAPAGAHERYLGVIRATVTSPEAVIEAFTRVNRAGLRDARRRGQISHDLYVRLGAPGEPMEIVGIDQWYSLEGLGEHYKTMDMATLASVFTGRPAASVWQQAPGTWSEW